jgi:hypothetical protein
MSMEILRSGEDTVRHRGAGASPKREDRASAERYLTHMQAALRAVGGDFADALASALFRLWVERDEVPALGDPARPPATLADVNLVSRRPIERAESLQDVHEWLSRLDEATVVLLAPVRSFRNYIPGARLGPCVAYRDREARVTVTLLEAGEAISLSPGDKRFTQPVHFEVLSGEPGSLRFAPAPAPGTPVGSAVRGEERDVAAGMRR